MKETSKIKGFFTFIWENISFETLDFCFNYHMNTNA